MIKHKNANCLAAKSSDQNSSNRWRHEFATQTRGLQIYERVLTAHSAEGKVGSHVTNTILKHSRKHRRTYQLSNRKY